MSLEEKNSAFALPQGKSYQKFKKENLANIRSTSIGRKSQRFEPPAVRTSQGGVQTGAPTPTPATGAFSNAFSNAFNI